MERQRRRDFGLTATRSKVGPTINCISEHQQTCRPKGLTLPLKNQDFIPTIIKETDFHESEIEEVCRKNLPSCQLWEPHAFNPQLD